MKNKNDYIIPDNNKRSFDSIIHLFIYLFAFILCMYLFSLSSPSTPWLEGALFQETVYKKNLLVYVEYWQSNRVVVRFSGVDG